MKYLLFIIQLLFIQNLYSININDPYQSPTFDDILKTIIDKEKYIFDDKNIKIRVPIFADNPVQVPILVDAKKIKNAKRLIIFADLNPIPKIIDMKLENLLPFISVNIKVAQETPIRALVLDENNLWHIASNNIKSFGGGCSVASVASSNTDYDKFLGKIKAKIFIQNNPKIFRIKTSIFHPMETGLVFGANEFFINKIIIKADENIIAKINSFSSISENPRFIFETTKKAKIYVLEFWDIDANKFKVDLK